MNNITKCLLGANGYRKFYDVLQSAVGCEYKFDEGFINAFDSFLAGDEKAWTNSQYKNFILFIDFADGKIQSTHKDYDALVELDKYLATMGV